MISNQIAPFIKEYLEEINSRLLDIDPTHRLTWCQQKWIAFTLIAMLVTDSLCWSRFERFSLGGRSVSALSWMLLKAKISWNFLLIAAVKTVIKKYSLSSGHLVIDDTDRARSKSTTEIGSVHKIFDKKTGGYFMGQNLVFLLLVTEKITIPVGFIFYVPDPKKIVWNKLDEELRNEGVPKSKRPPQPEMDPSFPSKIEIGIRLLSEFKKYFPEIFVQSISADAAFGSCNFFKNISLLFPKTQIISQLKSNQKVFYKGHLVPVSNVFNGMTSHEEEIPLRGGDRKKVSLVAARLRVESHDQVQLIVAIKYEEEDEYRYVVASDLSWRAVDIVMAYSMRWLVEVFIEDWKRYEGWGQLALQQGIDGSYRGVILSLLVDLCLIFHPDQFARIKNKQPACTVGSLREQLKNESLLMCFHEILMSESPMKKFAELKDKFSDFFILRDSTKHLSARDLPILEGTPSLKRKFGKLKLCYA